MVLDLGQTIEIRYSLFKKEQFDWRWMTEIERLVPIDFHCPPGVVPPVSVAGSSPEMRGGGATGVLG
jgi:hypothetical protein